MINRRSTVTALVGIGVAGLAAGCLSSNSGGSTSNGSAASGPGKSTIEVMYGLGPDTEPGFKADVSAWAAQNNITVKFTKSASWDTEIRTRVQGGNPPDVGLFPQPGLMCDLAKQKKLVPFDDATVKTDEATLVPGFVQAGTCADGKVYGLPNEVSVKSILWTDAPAFKAAGFHGPRHARRPAGADAEDQSRRQDPVVHRRRVRGGHRVADHRLDRGPRPAHRRPRQLRQVGQGPAEVQQPRDQARVGVLPEDRLR